MKRLSGFLKKYLAVLIFIGLWELITRLHLVSTLFIPPFSEVLVSIKDMTLTGELPFHVMMSLERALGGFLLAIVLGIPLGVLLSGWSRNLKLAIEPVVEVFSQTNPFILYHIILFVLGIGELTNISIIFWACVWPITFSTFSGILNVDEAIVKSGRVFNLSRLQLVQKILVPAAMPQIITGLRISAGYSLFMLIAAEMMGSSSGLGWMIINSQEYYRIDRVFAAVTLIAVLSLLLDSVMEYFQKRFVVLEAEGG